MNAHSRFLKLKHWSECSASSSSCSAVRFLGHWPSVVAVSDQSSSQTCIQSLIRCCLSHLLLYFIINSYATLFNDIQASLLLPDTVQRLVGREGRGKGGGGGREGSLPCAIKVEHCPFNSCATRVTWI